jgi:peroxiredoxin
VHDAKDLVDPDGNAAFPCGANSLRKTFIIDRNGILGQVSLKKVKETDLRDAIGKLRQPCQADSMIMFAY